MTTEEKQRDHIAEGKASYQRWSDGLVATEEGRKLYEEEAAKKDLWLQLVEARMAAGLTQKELANRLGISQSRVSRLEKRGYDTYTLTTLRRYVAALGDEFQLEVKVHHPIKAHKQATVGAQATL
jgi:predicted XRE-type DNA-binding protein